MFRVLIIFCITISSMFAKPIVTVSIPPQKYFIEQIAGETLEIIVMVKPEENHETYEPKPAQMIALSKSSIYFSIDLPFEHAWLQRFKDVAPKMKIVDTSKGIKKEQISTHDKNSHDWHIWLSPLLVKIQAKNIADALIVSFPQNKKIYEENLNIFLQNIESLHEEIKEKLSTLKNRNFLVFHPSWGSFADEYALVQIAVEFESKEPKPAEIINLIKQTKKKEIKVLFSEPQVSQRSATIISKELNVKIVLIDPLASNWSENMRLVCDEILKGNK